MNRLVTGFALLASASLLAACQTASPGSPEAKAIAIQKIEEINDDDLKEELILTGLRTIYGVDIERLNNFFNSIVTGLNF